MCQWNNDSGPEWGAQPAPDDPRIANRPGNPNWHGVAAWFDEAAHMQGEAEQQARHADIMTATRGQPRFAVADPRAAMIARANVDEDFFELLCKTDEEILEAAEDEAAFSRYGN